MRMRHILLLPLLTLLLVGCAADQPQAFTPGQSQQTFQTTVSQDVTLKYLLHLPADYGTDDRVWPTMLFLHGAGERGANLDLVKVHGPPKLAAADPGFPFIVISPQCPQNDWWSDETMQLALLALLDEVSDAYAIDEDRLYVTGLSMGGYGTWGLVARQPNRFAAIAPICGGGDPAKAASFAHVPVWAFHGGKDSVVPVRRTQEMIEALRATGAEARLTIYPDAEHDSWTETYANPKLYEWLLSHTLR
jgi:predicted peptidase